MPSAIIEEELKQIHEKVSPQEVKSATSDFVYIELKKTKLKQLVLLFQFPDGYPETPIIVELKSNHLSFNLIRKLHKLVEKEQEGLKGQPQILPIVDFLRSFLFQNQLIMCVDEIAKIQDLVTSKQASSSTATSSNSDLVKLKEKAGIFYVLLQQDKYYLRLKVTVPDTYPAAIPLFEVADTNFILHYAKMFLYQAQEIARPLVEGTKEWHRTHPVDTWQSQHCLFACVHYIFECVQRFPTEPCWICKEPVLPVEPSEQTVETLTAGPMRLERIYCSHIYHHHCLDKYLTSPPYPKEGKKCLAPKCNKYIVHQSWHKQEVYEARWAHKQARQREIGEVSDMLNLRSNRNTSEFDDFL